MTNLAADFKYQVKCDSVANSQHNPQFIGKLNLVTPESALRETTSVGKMKKDLKIFTSPPMTNGIIKNGNNKSCEKKRKLTFNVNEKDELIEEIHTYSFPSDVDHNEVWWMEDELDEILTDAMLVAEHFTQKRKDWQNKTKSILKIVAGINSSRKIDGECCQPRKALKGSDLDFVVDCDARGLELYIHPIFQKNREKAVKGVIKIQEDYNACEKKKGKADPELRIKVLRAQSLKLTNLARAMAKTLADGDRRAALKDEEGTAEVSIRCACAELPSEEFVTSEVDHSEDDKPAPRPRAISPWKPSGPRRTPPAPPQRGRALQELQKQDHQRLKPASKLGSSGGIGSLKAALDDISGDDSD